MTNIFVLAAPSLNRNALMAYLNAIPDLKLVFCGDSPERLFQAFTKVEDGIVIIDLNGDQAVLKQVIDEIKLINPQLKRVVISEGRKTQSQIKTCGADEVLQYGLLGDRLASIISQPNVL